ncbi:unnamed protein product [Tilletia caries]|nr:unnamed protein product [Tilletia caries]CAD7066691.1 unnamed protein product [Tilletia caries]
MTRAQRTAAAARAHALTMVRAITAAAAHSAEQWPVSQQPSLITHVHTQQRTYHRTSSVPPQLGTSAVSAMDRLRDRERRVSCYCFTYCLRHGGRPKTLTARTRDAHLLKDEDTLSHAQECGIEPPAALLRAIENNVCYSTAEAIQSFGDSNSSDGSDQEPASPHGSPLLRQADFDEPFLDGGDPFLDVGADESEAESSVGGTGSDLDEDEMGGRDDLFDDDELENELDQMLAGGMLFGEDDGDEGGARMAMKTEASISNNSSSGTRASTPRTGKTFSTL